MIKSIFDKKYLFFMLLVLLTGTSIGYAFTYDGNANIYDYDVYQVQLKLKKLGYNPGPSDGLCGPRTSKTIEKFKKDRQFGNPNLHFNQNIQFVLDELLRASEELDELFRASQEENEVQPVNDWTNSPIMHVMIPDRQGIEEESSYPYAVLKLVLKKSGRPFTLKISDSEMNDARTRKTLEKNEISVAWFGTSKEFEQKFLPVRIPITRGVLGYRLFIINKDNQKIFDQVKTKDDLTSLIAGQGLDWSDVKILRNANLKVETNKFDQLFAMTEKKRIDYFPLGANEIFGLIKNRQKMYPNITVEKKIVLIYPFDFLFFVNKENQELHDVIYDGFMAAYNDKSFIKLFENHPDNIEFIEKANISNRIQIRIPNPLMTKETSSIPDKYWIQ